MSDPYRDAEASLTENLAQRKAELDTIDETLIPLHERREEVLTEIDLISARLGSLKSQRECPSPRSGRPAVMGFGLFVMSAFSAAYLVRPTCDYGSSRARDAQSETRALRAIAEMALQDSAKGSCPTLADIAGKNASRDPWKNPYRIQCVDKVVHVYSSGPDGIANTTDDIRDDSPLSAIHARMR